ncbi:MAG: hypothetical protein PGN07_08525 [Aeromicrobium erythreum]
MAMTPGDPLERATAEMRDEASSAAWLDVSETVKRRVSGIVRPAASLVAVTDDGSTRWADDGSRVLVSERVLLPRLRRSVASDQRAVDDVRVRRDGDRCVAVEVDLVCAYGSDLAAQGDDVHAVVSDELRDLLGPDPERDVVVRVVDVTDRDPRDD